MATPPKRPRDVPDSYSRRHNKVSIEGNIAAGKSTFVRLLQAASEEWEVIPEPIGKWCNVQNDSEDIYQDPSIRGIFHFSGKEQMTKYEMAVAMAQAFNLPSNHLIPLTELPADLTSRPINSQLNCSRLELLNLSVEPQAFTAAITDCLWPFTADKRWRQTVFH